MADQEPPKGERKFWGQPIKYMSYGVGISTLVFALKPYFYTRAEGDATSEQAKIAISQMAELKEIMNKGFANVDKGLASQNKIFLDHVTEETRVREHGNDVMRTRIADEKADRIRDTDQLNNRVDVVMELFKLKHSKTN